MIKKNFPEYRPDVIGGKTGYTSIALNTLVIGARQDDTELITVAVSYTHLDVYKRQAVDHISYDYQKAASVQSGYLPIPDATLASGKGICFDYAAVMTSMLRSLDIPTKLVIGYTGGTYHAWVSVYLTGQGLSLLHIYCRSD